MPCFSPFGRSTWLILRQLCQGFAKLWVTFPFLGLKCVNICAKPWILFGSASFELSCFLGLPYWLPDIKFEQHNVQYLISGLIGSILQVSLTCMDKSYCAKTWFQHRLHCYVQSSLSLWIIWYHLVCFMLMDACGAW